MPKLRHLMKAVCGLDTPPRHDGRLCPAALKGWVPIALAHDRRLSAGIFTARERRRKRGKPRRYRIVVWRTYGSNRTCERATTLLYRDEIDPALALLAKCGDRVPPT